MASQSKQDSDNAELVAQFVGRMATYNAFEDIRSHVTLKSEEDDVSSTRLVAKSLMSDFLNSNLTNILLDRSVFEVAMETFMSLFPKLDSRQDIGIMPFIQLCMFDKSLPSSPTALSEAIAKVHDITDFELGTAYTNMVVGNSKTISEILPSSKYSDLATKFEDAIKDWAKSPAAKTVPTGWLEKFMSLPEPPAFLKHIGELVYDGTTPLDASKLDKTSGKLERLTKDHYELAKTIRSYHDLIFFVKVGDLESRGAEAGLLHRLCIGAMQTGSQTIYALSVSRVKWSMALRAIASMLTPIIIEPPTDSNNA